MRYSSFARYGFLRFSSKKSEHELVYDSMIASVDPDGLGRSYNTSKGTRTEATIYMNAQGVGRALLDLERAQNQASAAKCLESIPTLERDSRIVPKPNATIQERRNALIAKSRLNRGARRENIEDQLNLAIGADFIAYRVVKESEQTLWPAAPGNGPGVYSRNDLSIKVGSVLNGNALVGSPDWVSYRNIDPTAPPQPFLKGDVVCMNAGDLENAERVTVTDTGTTDTGNLKFQATFTLFHGFGFAITNGPFPAQFSTRRFAFVVVSDAASIDASKRALVNDVMSRCARGVSCWAIVKKSSSTTIGPFVIGTSPIGAVSFGTITI